MYQTIVFILTYFDYVPYHYSRLPSYQDLVTKNGQLQKAKQNRLFLLNLKYWGEDLSKIYKKKRALAQYRKQIKKKLSKHKVELSIRTEVSCGE
ncbi:hypothetical protein BpHYR1_025962 [Brachionus plicatilis]|uniref:Uncharacterized protein n=1 Tax=Brachionus plicatilis TaxID=10195 RepID=A0A3M7SM66_BRAPC|nr:hypothetical protein BpHYR1_025962 [Brachionus plicatilis]